MKKDPALLSRRKAADRFKKSGEKPAVIDFIPRPPASLSPEAQHEWQKMAEKLARLGWLNAPGKMEHLRLAARLLGRLDAEGDEFPVPLYAQLRQAVAEVFKPPRIEDIEVKEKAANPFQDF